MPRRPSAKIHILLILGSSPSTAKARYLLEIDGFRVEQFGESEYVCRDSDHVQQEPHSSWVNDKADGSVVSTISPQLSSLPTTPHKSPSRYSKEWNTPTSSSSNVSNDSVSVPSSPSVSSRESLFEDQDVSDCELGSSEQVNPLVFAHSTEETSLRTGERQLFKALFAHGDSLGFGDEIRE